jgi:hypothetical protein
MKTTVLFALRAVVLSAAGLTASSILAQESGCDGGGSNPGYNRGGRCQIVEEVTLNGVDRNGCLDQRSETKTRAKITLNTRSGEWTCTARARVSNKSRSSQCYYDIASPTSYEATSCEYSVSRNGSACYVSRGCDSGNIPL